MNEEIKTAVFWGVAVAMIGIATIVAWPPTEETAGGIVINEPLFKDFKDPLAAASMKIVTFDEEQGQLDTFEVRKDQETGAWTIPSRQGYPADAVEQMKDAANALVDLRILDMREAKPEEHVDLGVAEPALEDLEIGDEGVGRLVTLKDESQKTLASLIIGDPVKDSDGQLYVRKPGQDPVYVVKLDVTPLTTNFQKWIEQDLLQLSSIDVQQMQIKDYNAALNIGGQISLTRNYTAEVSLDGSQWKLDKLQEYEPGNPLADPKTVEVGDDEKLNATKLNEIKNALDDLKIVNVVRKPEGMSANLRADKDLASDSKAVSSLASRGFYPVPMGPQGEYEVLSANGELTVGLKDGVQYVIRFGNIAGLGDKQDSEENDDPEKKSSAGVNRYLLVTTRVDESKFPAPGLKPIPQTLEELDVLLNPPKPAEDEPQTKDVDATDAKADASEPAGEEKGDGEKSDTKKSDEKSSDKPKDEPDSGDKKSDASAPAEDDAPTEDTKGEDAGDADESGDAKPADEPADDAGESGESEASGSGEATGTGQGQEPDGQKDSSQKDDGESKPEDAEIDDSEKDDSEKSAPKEPTDDSESKPAPNADPAEDDAKTEASDADDKKATDEAPATTEDDKNEELSEEEKLERLEAEQEKITKENQRLIDERKDKLEAAQKRVKDLNARFADWYYVIPEETYTKLRISRDDLFEKPASDAAATSLPPGGPQFPPGGPQFNFTPPK